MVNPVLNISQLFTTNKELFYALIIVPSRKSTGLYRGCAALASFSGSFDVIIFIAVNFEHIVEKVWFGLVWMDGLNKKTK